MKLSERGPISPDTLMETKALRTHDLFFSPQEDAQNFDSVLRQVQEYISGKYSTLIVEGGTGEVKAQVKRYIAKYVQDNRIAVKGMTGRTARGCPVYGNGRVFLPHQIHLRHRN